MRRAGSHSSSLGWRSVSFAIGTSSESFTFGEWRVALDRLSLEGGIINSLGEVGDLVGVSIFIHNTHLLCLEVIHQQVVELLGDLEDAAEHVHLASECHCHVPTSAQLREWLSYLGPCFGGHVELPQVTEFVVLLVLTTKNENAVSIGNSRVCVSLSREHLRRLLCSPQERPCDRVRCSELCSKDRVDSGASDESSEEHELLVNLNHSVIVDALRNSAL